VRACERPMPKAWPKACPRLRVGRLKTEGGKSLDNLFYVSICKQPKTVDEGRSTNEAES
jgi:hypothetical protein